MVGLGCCPADAIPEVKSSARYVAKCTGGKGVIREIAELITK
jgi:3-deoxy-D-manno-octulosonate 8-phosphate phosphatase KdsC-like HAD superfamily phosphatase